MSSQKSRSRVVTDPAKRAWSAPPTSQTTRRKAKAGRTPDDIIRDVRGLKLRQRVSLVLNDQNIREELEEMVHQVPQSRLEGIRAYQDFLVLPTGPGHCLPSGAVVTPIADIRGSDTLNYPKKERSLRCLVASVCRLVDLLGWSYSIYSHVTVRLSSDLEELLINPCGLLNSEITASCLLKTDFNGNIKDQGSTNLDFSKATLVSHTAIYQSRRDVKCAIYTCQPAVVVVSCMKTGILPISNEALLLGDIAYHEISGNNETEKESIARDIEGSAKVLILHNHGMICLGETVQEAFYYTYIAVKACEYQVRAAGAGLDNLSHCSEQYKNDVNEDNSNKTVKGKQEFEAWMRVLDSMGYKTGYAYENPEVFQAELKPDHEATKPVASWGYKNLYHHTEFEGEPVRRAHSIGHANTYRNRRKWLNTPAKPTEYRKDSQKAELDDDCEPAIIKDLQTVKENEYFENKASEEVRVLESNTLLNESAPDEELCNGESTTTQSECKTTYVVHTSYVESEPSADVHVLAVDGENSAKEKRESEESSSDEHDEGCIGVESTEPNSPTKKRGAKVKKRSSIRDTLVKTFSKK